MPFDNSIFWIDVDKVKPNPYQPRKEFDAGKLEELADSIRQYGVLQPLVVTRKEIEKEDGGLVAEYELIAGERRLRAARIAGIGQVPSIIRQGTEEESERVKLELAIIENVQREDLNLIDRAKAFKRLADEFDFSHTHIGKKIGKSREYVSNSIRVLALPEDIHGAIQEGKLSEGHARTLLMLADHPEEQMTLYKDILYKKISVRDAERIARHTAHERVRRRTPDLDPESMALEERLSNCLGSRVEIERREEGGRVMIDLFSSDDLLNLLNYLELYGGRTAEEPAAESAGPAEATEADGELSGPTRDLAQQAARGEAEEKERDDDDDLYSVRNFTI